MATIERDGFSVNEDGDVSCEGGLILYMSADKKLRFSDERWTLEEVETAIALRKEWLAARAAEKVEEGPKTKLESVVSIAQRWRLTQPSQAALITAMCEICETLGLTSPATVAARSAEKANEGPKTKLPDGFHYEHLRSHWYVMSDTSPNYGHVVNSPDELPLIRACLAAAEELAARQSPAAEVREPEAKRYPMFQTAEQLVERYLACAYKIWEMFPTDPLGDDVAHFMCDRLEALLAKGLIGPVETAQPSRQGLPEGYEINFSLSGRANLVQEMPSDGRRREIVQISSDDRCEALEALCVAYRARGRE